MDDRTVELPPETGGLDCVYSAPHAVEVGGDALSRAACVRRCGDPMETPLEVRRRSPRRHLIYEPKTN